ncbi:MULTISPECIES: hypothetical protein [Bacillus cereus group]|uniref:hypothetical protein n=1 Tax=Bacillus cereus group TaxID=86661 RepID=UPI001AEF0693|nr:MULTISPECIES: hypothetical protein [Bacillus cereus group]QTR81829.1 hypothetical protein JC777_14770 [Bacillus cytotoxicus]QTR85566.1 hypothetical protein JC774_13275 [Bacillus cytotoxicus]HDR4573108.1 hypothetical protein [Bacillus cytotoxicus]HDR4589142.1 hypothetical protein [Bacillus cytotoxicus]HDR7310297.1 hypothetical protein [Bacillus cytotoxicus]
MWQYIMDNKEWIFSGVGLPVIGIVIAIFKGNKKDRQESTYTFKQKSGKNSTNYQGHTLHINSDNKNEKENKENV